RYYLSMAYYSRGDYDRAIALLQTSVDAVEDSLLHSRFGLHYVPAVGARAWLTICLVDRGEFAQARAWADEAVQLAEAVDDPFSLILATTAYGHRHLVQGALHQAIPALERGMRICEERDLPLLISHL